MARRRNRRRDRVMEASERLRKAEQEYALAQQEFDAAVMEMQLEKRTVTTAAPDASEAPTATPRGVADQGPAQPSPAATAPTGKPGSSRSRVLAVVNASTSIVRAKGVHARVPDIPLRTVQSTLSRLASEGQIATPSRGAYRRLVPSGGVSNGVQSVPNGTAQPSVGGDHVTP